MIIHISRKPNGLIFLFVLVILIAGCTSGEISNTTNSVDLQLTPTMHTAFQLTPASQRMPDPIPVEGYGMVEIDLGRNGSGQVVVENETAVSPENLDAANADLVSAGNSNAGSGFVEGKLESDVDALVVNKVIVITPMAQPASAVKPNVAASVSRPTPMNTSAPVVSNVSTATTEETGLATPTPICGGNRFHEAGPATTLGPMPINFEEIGTWMRSEKTYGALLQTDLLYKSGQKAAWLCYFFNSPEDETAVFTQIHPVQGQPNTVRMWVYGNRSGHFLGVWILDKDHETWLVPLGPIMHEGWEEMEATFSGPNAEMIFYISGPSNNQIDYPISFRGISLNDSPDGPITYGGVVIDDINFISK